MHIGFSSWNIFLLLQKTPHNVDIMPTRAAGSILDSGFGTAAWHCSSNILIPCWPITGSLLRWLHPSLGASQNPTNHMTSSTAPLCAQGKHPLHVQTSLPCVLWSKWTQTKALWSQRWEWGGRPYICQKVGAGREIITPNLFLLHPKYYCYLLSRCFAASKYLMGLKLSCFFLLMWCIMCMVCVCCHLQK